MWHNCYISAFYYVFICHQKMHDLMFGKYKLTWPTIIKFLFFYADIEKIFEDNFRNFEPSFLIYTDRNWHKFGWLWRINYSTSKHGSNLFRIRCVYDKMSNYHSVISTLMRILYFGTKYMKCKLLVFSWSLGYTMWQE